MPIREPTISINSDDARHFAVPLAKTDQHFQNFLMSYTDIGLKYRENKIHLMVVTYTEEEAKKINFKVIVDEFTKTTFPADVTVVTATGADNRL